MFTDEERTCVDELAELIRQRAGESHLTKWFRTPRWFNMASQLWMLAVLAQRPFELKITRNRIVLLLSDIFLEVAGVKSVSAKTIQDVKKRITSVTDDGAKRDYLLLHLFVALARPPYSVAHIPTPDPRWRMDDWIKQGEEVWLDEDWRKAVGAREVG